MRRTAKRVFLAVHEAGMNSINARPQLVSLVAEDLNSSPETPDHGVRSKIRLLAPVMGRIVERRRALRGRARYGLGTGVVICGDVKTPHIGNDTARGSI